MNYSFLQAGKRMRPLLLLSKLLDYNIPYQSGFEAAAALEMIHTYSLIHDDLPAMDNDDYRRGELTNHKKFSEAIAILAGDALLTKAFELISFSQYSNNIKVNLVKHMSKYAGVNGMIYGQQLDIEHNEKAIEIDKLSNIHRYKTGRLFALSLGMAAIISENDQEIELL